MRNILQSLFLGSFITLLISACTKDIKETTTEGLTPSELDQIASLGFSTHNVQKTDAGYLVEGDIILTAADLNASPFSPNLIIAQEEQYRTFNIVNPSKHPTINVALNNNSSVHQTVFSAALDEAIRRYNALGLQISLQRVTSSPNITVVAFYENSSTLGSAGFPNSSGDPYYQVRMNTYHYKTANDDVNRNYIATIMAHEIGHCIGFRHTDYMKRSFSCGWGGNEGQAKNGVGAVHIPGTPTKPDAASWMLACIGSGVNRPFNANDRTALTYLY